MSVKHGTLTIPGTHENLIVPLWERVTQRESTFGVDGQLQLNGGKRERQITVPIWIYNNYSTTTQLTDFLETTLGDQIGEVETLTELGDVSRTFENCDFQGFQIERGPLPSTSLGWFAIGTLLFTQIAP